MSRQVPYHALAASTAALLLAACGGGGSGAPLNTLPAGIAEHSRTAYTATAPGSGTTAATQDLLTGGLGKTGLGLPAAPAYADPLNPTALELRLRRAPMGAGVERESLVEREPLEREAVERDRPERG